MHHVIASLVVIICGAGPAAALQSGAGAAGGTRASACALLTRELVAQFTPLEKQALDLVLTIPPQEDPVGPSGSACEYGGIGLQIDPFAAPARTEQELAKMAVPVSGLGDAAYFRDNRGRWAELYVRAGSRVFTIQMGVPMGRTSESIRPNVLGLAKALLPRLK
jgi:hypothetical protein